MRLLQILFQPVKNPTSRSVSSWRRHR